MTDSTDRVTTKQFYELQLATLNQLKEYHAEIRVLNTRFDAKVTADKLAGEAVDEKLDAQKKSIESMEARSVSIEDDFLEHKVVDNRFKGVIGVIQLVILAIQGIFISK